MIPKYRISQNFSSTPQSLPYNRASDVTFSGRDKIATNLEVFIPYFLIFLQENSKFTFFLVKHECKIPNGGQNEKVVNASKGKSNCNPFEAPPTNESTISNDISTGENKSLIKMPTSYLTRSRQSIPLKSLKSTDATTNK